MMTRGKNVLFSIISQKEWFYYLNCCFDPFHIIHSCFIHITLISWFIIHVFKFRKLNVSRNSFGNLWGSHACKSQWNLWPTISNFLIVVEIINGKQWKNYTFFLAVLTKILFINKYCKKSIVVFIFFHA